MVDNSEPITGATPLTPGRTLYAPGTIAAYTVLANIPVGLILYGLNLRARDQRRFGGLVLLLGGVCFGLFIIVAMSVGLPRLMILIGALAAAHLYRLEKQPFNKAIQEGASRARWWPPALWLLAGITVLVVLDNLLLPMMD